MEEPMAPESDQRNFGRFAAYQGFLIAGLQGEVAATAYQRGQIKGFAQGQRATANSRDVPAILKQRVDASWH